MNVTEFGSMLMVYVNEDIPFNFLNNFSVESLFEIIATELNQLIRKQILLGIDKSAQSDNESIGTIGNILNKYLYQHENTLIAGEFNMTIDNSQLNNFMQLFDLTIQRSLRSIRSPQINSKSFNGPPRKTINRSYKRAPTQDNKQIILTAPHARQQIDHINILFQKL